jgi:hypothetical protein
MLLGFEIGQRWPEAVMHSCGSYFVPVPYHGLDIRMFLMYAFRKIRNDMSK